MENEEIQRRYDEMERTLPTGQSMSLEDHREVERMVITFACSLVSQAYEETRQVIARAISDLPNDEQYERADTVPAVAYELGRKDGLRIANDKIRALTDSLICGTVSS